MTPAIAHDHKYFFFSLVTACDLHATTACENRPALAYRQSRAVIYISPCTIWLGTPIAGES